MSNQVLMLKEGEVKFNIPLKLRKSFVVAEESEDRLNTQSPGYMEMPEQFKNLNLGNGKYFWGYASFEQVDMQGDLFPIATLEELAPGLTQAPYNKVFLFHNYDDIAIGTILATATDSRGLMILAKLNEDHQRAWEVWNSILNGSLDGFSMGGSFIEVESYYDEELDMIVSVAKKAIASEVSLTSIPVNGGSLLQGAFQKAKKKYAEKFGDPKIFMKGQKLENGENFKYNKNYDKGMVDTSKFTKEQKEVFDKMVSDGKSEDDAYKEVMAQQKKEAAESVNEDLTGNDSKKACDKKMKKSAEGESEEPEQPEAPETPEEETPEEPENPETPEEPETPETPEEPEDKTDYKAEYEKAMEENKLLREKIAGFEKSVKPEKTEDKPIRKSAKTPEEQTPNPSNSNQVKDQTPFLSWLKK